MIGQYQLNLWLRHGEWEECPPMSDVTAALRDGSAQGMAMVVVPDIGLAAEAVEKLAAKLMDAAQGEKPPGGTA